MRKLAKLAWDMGSNTGNDARIAAERSLPLESGTRTFDYGRRRS